MSRHHNTTYNITLKILSNYNTEVLNYLYLSYYILVIEKKKHNARYHHGCFYGTAITWAVKDESSTSMETCCGPDQVVSRGRHGEDVVNLGGGKCHDPPSLGGQTLRLSQKSRYFYTSQGASRNLNPLRRLWKKVEGNGSIKT